MKALPFRGYTFDPEKVGDIDRVVTQPYDKISDALLNDYEARSPFNVVRLIRPRSVEGDSNKYTRAADLLTDFIASGALRRDEEPAMYAYYQTYDVDGERRTRKGFVALGGLEDFSSGGVRPHEKTHAGPKADRLNLLRATATNLGQIFMLYSDPKNSVNAILDRHTGGDPLMKALDDVGEVHRLWRITDKTDISAIGSIMEDREGFIADGHHRYETALDYRNEMAGRETAGRTETPANRMMTFVNMDDPGLTILAGHRAVYDVAPAKIDGLLDALAARFEVTDFPFCDQDRTDVQGAFLAALRSPKEGEHRIGLAVNGRQTFHILSLPADANLDELIKNQHCPAWRRLDVSILHSLVLKPVLGIGDEQIDREENVNFIRGAEPAIQETLAGRYQAVFLLNPTKIQDVRDVALAQDRMPQKSTDFYPKLLTGMVFNRIDYTT